MVSEAAIVRSFRPLVKPIKRPIYPLSFISVTLLTRIESSLFPRSAHEGRLQVASVFKQMLLILHLDFQPALVHSSAPVQLVQAFSKVRAGLEAAEASGHGWGMAILTCEPNAARRGGSGSLGFHKRDRFRRELAT